jgi:Delta7-sterol 5-desaturase
VVRLLAGAQHLPVHLLCLRCIRDARAWLASWAPLSGMSKQERMTLLREENAWKNGLVMWMFPDSIRDAMPHFTQTWARCIILCAAVYFLIGGLWCYYAYFCFGDKLFKPGTMPGAADVLEQIKVRSLLLWYSQLEKDAP